MRDDLIEVTVTGPDADWLGGLCRELVEARLCASAHVVAPVRSIYRWEGAVAEAGEARAFLRSRRGRLDEVVAFVTARHPYRTPNVTALPIVGGNPAYLDWIARETDAPRS
jgi:periplasmic divalent cation tolerance protein